MPRPSRMLKVESFNVISVTARRGWKIGEADASRDVGSPLHSACRTPGLRVRRGFGMVDSCIRLKAPLLGAAVLVVGLAGVHSTVSRARPSRITILDPGKGRPGRHEPLLHARQSGPYARRHPGRAAGHAAAGHRAQSRMAGCSSRPARRTTWSSWTRRPARSCNASPCRPTRPRTSRPIPFPRKSCIRTRKASSVSPA